MQSRKEAIHFLKSAEVQTGKRCFVRKAIKFKKHKR